VGTDRVAVITGTTHGIGQVTALELARAGCTVVMLCRNVDAARSFGATLSAQTRSPTPDVIACDLASLASVRAAAEAVRRRYAVLSLLVNNAGMVTTRHRLSPDGLELTFATNHLGPFLLTELLRDRLAPQGRIVTVASRIHYRGALHLEAIRDPRARFNARAAYAQSKLANVMHTFALARRLEGTSVTVNCLHPGVVATNLLPRWLRLIKPLITPVMLDAVRGAQTTLHLALSPAVAGISGCYFDEHQQVQLASAEARDIALQEALWEYSVSQASLAERAC